jgi:hypothetical protein
MATELTGIHQQLLMKLQLGSLAILLEAYDMPAGYEQNNT